MDILNTYMKTNEKFVELSSGRLFKDHTQRIHCADGFHFSAQASSGHYCQPRTDDGYPYSCVELGYPSSADPMIAKYALDASKPTDTVYLFVPVEVVVALIEAHGGIVDAPEKTA